MVRAIVERLARFALLVAGFALATLALVQLWHVVGRYVFNRTPGWTEPVSIVLMNVTMLLGAAVAVHRGTHFAFTIGLDGLPAGPRRIAYAATQLIAGAVGIALAWQGLQLACDSWDVKSAGADLPQGAMYVPLVIGGVLMGVFALGRALDPSPSGKTGE